MAQIYSHWNQWQSSQDPHWKHALASTACLWKFQPSGQSVLNILMVASFMALENSLPVTGLDAPAQTALNRAGFSVLPLCMAISYFLWLPEAISPF